MADLRYYIGPWVKAEGIWSPPAGTVGLVDLGNNSQVAQSAGDSRNIGFFCQDPAFAALAADWTLLGRGDCREIAWTAAMRDSWYAMTGVRPSVAANTWLVDALYSHLTTHADDAGDATCPPLMPTIGRELELHLGGHSRVKHEVFRVTESRHGPTLARIKRDLRQMRADAKAGRMGRVTGRGASRRFAADEDFHRRVLTALCEKLRIDPSSDDWEALAPVTWPRAERPLPHSTTLTESFTGANADLSAADIDLTWAEPVGDIDVASNQASHWTTGGNSGGRAESDLSSSDHYCSGYLGDYDTGNGGSSSGRNRGGVAVRCSSSGSDCYFGGTIRNSLSRSYGVHKYVSSTETGLFSAGDGGSDFHTGKLEIDGSSLVYYVSDVSTVTGTDTSISSGTRCGIHRYLGTAMGGKGLVDDWEAADLAVAFAALDDHGMMGFFGL